MKARLYPLLLATLAVTSSLLGAAATPERKGPTPPPLSPRFVQVRERIDALFHQRNSPAPMPAPSTNPFAVGPAAINVVRETPVAGGTEGVPPAGTPAEAPSQDLAILQQAVATLRVTGTFKIGGQVQLVINGRTYKKGDVIPTQGQNPTVYLRVREVTLHSVTLGLNDAEMSLKF